MRRKIDWITVLWWTCAITIVILIGNVIVKTIIIARAEIAPVQLHETIRRQYGEYIDEAADRYSLCPELLEAMIEQESAGQEDIVSTGGDVGLLQVNPRWHRERMDKLGVDDLTDPYSNILVAADYLAELFGRYEDIYIVLQVYNGTSNAVEKAESGEYTEYARRIADRAMELERLHGK